MIDIGTILLQERVISEIGGITSSGCCEPSGRKKCQVNDMSRDEKVIEWMEISRVCWKIARIDKLGFRCSMKFPG